MFVSWDDVNGWSHVTPTPTFTWQPQLHTTDLQFNAAASFSVIPSVSMHFNNLFTYTMTATPELDVTVSGDVSSRQVRDDACERQLGGIGAWCDTRPGVQQHHSARRGFKPR